jgi:Eco57I restriction-modification methylase
MVQQQYDVTPQDILALRTPEQITDFFTRLGYVVTETANMSPAAMDALKYELHRNGDVAEQITTFWQIAKRRDETYDEFFVYLYVLPTLNATAINHIFLDLCKLQAQFLLVLTNQSYSELNFLYIDRFIGNPTNPKKSARVRLIPLFDLDESATTALPGKISGNAGLSAHKRILTVKRVDPATNKVALRVLNRLAWRNNRDIAAQCAVLRSAFDIAEWSEKYFNNRALFSDYYLNENLPQGETWQKTRRDGREAHEMQRAYTEMRVAYEKMEQKILDLALSAQELRTTFTEAVLGWLGFAVQQGSKSAKKRAPDYLLSTQDVRGNRKQRVAFCLAYGWDRNLDTYADEVNDLGEEPTDPTAFENPGAVVVTLFDTAPVEWAILTNGKTWRLYSARTHNRATNYYEIDLAELLSLPRDPDALDETLKAFRYFWLLFRADAFDARPQPPKYADTALTFLDYLLKESHSYAVQLGESLKDKIFEQVFAYFAEGLLTDAWNAGTLPQDLAVYRPEQQQQLLKPFFNATLTFLYRLLFVLYAESRNLLPVEERGYKPHSLEQIKSSIANEIGNNEEQAVDAIGRIYKNDSYEFYGYLSELFQAIDKGDAAFNVPTYNGGLFQTQVTRTCDDWRLFDAADTATLPPIASASPEEILALHRIDDRRLALGLDKLARDKEQKKHNNQVPVERLMPVDYKSLGVRQLGSIYEGLLEFKLRVALEDMVEIKGKIVPRAEAIAQGQYKQGRHVEYPARRAYIENDRHERKVTGSYYTPDYIVEYIVEQTLGPVIDQKEEDLRKEFRQIEQNILGAQRRNRDLQTQAQGAGIHPVESKLQAPELVDRFFDVKVLDPAMGSGHFLVEAVDYITRRMIAFLAQIPHNPVRYAIKQIERDIADEADKQHIVIDRNQLTEINLLKRQVLKRCIYGVDLNNMAVELAKVSVWLDSFTIGAPLSFLDHHLKCGNSLIGDSIEEVEKSLNRHVLGNQFAGLLSGTALMLQLSKQTDVTIQDVQNSQSTYSDATHKLAPYKNLLNLWVSEYFGNKGAKITVNTFGQSIIDGDYEKLNKEDLKAIALAKEVADVSNKNFFHWDLEFPEIFFDAKGRKPEEFSGFDAVVGNPPYDELSEDALGRPIDEEAFLSVDHKFSFLGGGRLNWYHYFITLALQITRPKGMHGFIVPMSLMSDQFTLSLRRWLLEKHQPICFEVFPQKDNPSKRVFFEAKLSTCMYIVCRTQQTKQFQVRTHPAQLILPESPSYITDLDAIKNLDPSNLSIPLVSNQGWQAIQKLVNNPRTGRMSQVGARPTSGEIVFNKQFRKYLTEDDNDTLVLRGSHVQRYELVDEAKQGEPVYLKKDLYLKDAKPGSKAFDHLKERIVYQEGAAIDNWRRVIATYLPAGLICGHKICYFTEYKILPTTLLAVFNSKIINWYVTSISTNNSLSAYLIGAIPFPSFNMNITSQKQRNIRLQEIRRNYEQYLQENQRFLLHNTPPMSIYIHIRMEVPYNRIRGFPRVLHRIGMQYGTLSTCI